MKKIFILPMLFVTALTSCGDLGVVPVAYTRYVPNNEEQYIYYTSYVYATSNGHIVVWKNKEESEEKYANPDIRITFMKTCGADDVEDLRYMLVDLSKDYYSEMTVDLTTNSELYDASKKIYVNGVTLTPYDTFDGDSLVVYHYRNYGLKRTNPGGKLDYTLVNTIEYK